MEGGTLNLPNSLPALNEATAFNTNGKDYATGVSIDLSELTYYPNMPMPQFNDGNGSNIIDVTENNSRLTFKELDNNRKTIEYITTPENPAPTPLMRSIFAKKSNNETKGKTRDITTSNIVGYVDINIPPPSISSTISSNGYYKFNTDWNGLIEGTDQDHALSVYVQPSLQSKTITIDSIESNQSTVIEKTGDYVSLIPPLASNIYNGGEIEVGGTLGTDTYRLFDGNTSSNIGTTNQTVNIKFDHFVTVNKIWIQVGDGGSWRTSNKYRLYGCNNDQYEDLVILYESAYVDSYTTLEQVINENNTRFKYYRIVITRSGDRGSVTREIKLYTFQSTFDGINTVTIVNNTDSKIYKGYNNNNKYSITQTGDGTITIPTNYQALGEIKYNVNVPTTLVDNADVDSQNNNVISTNGTYTIPSGKTGWNSFEVDVPQTNVNNYTNYTSSYPLEITSQSGTISIPNGYTGLGEISYNLNIQRKYIRYLYVAGLKTNIGEYDVYKTLTSGNPLDITDLESWSRQLGGTIVSPKWYMTVLVHEIGNSLTVKIYYSDSDADRDRTLNLNVNAITYYKSFAVEWYQGGTGNPNRIFMTSIKDTNNNVLFQYNENDYTNNAVYLNSTFYGIHDSNVV